MNDEKSLGNLNKLVNDMIPETTSQLFEVYIPYFDDEEGELNMLNVDQKNASLPIARMK